jgi:hypothetical protein
MTPHHTTSHTTMRRGRCGRCGFAQCTVCESSLLPGDGLVLAELQIPLSSHYITIHQTASHYMTLHHTTPNKWHYMTIHHTTWHYITLHDTTSHNITLHDTASHDVILHDSTSHYMTLLHTTSHMTIRRGRCGRYGFAQCTDCGSRLLPRDGFILAEIQIPLSWNRL